MARYKTPGEYWKTLGLRPGASENEIRSAYLALVKRWHPDRFPPNSPAQLSAQEKLKAINEAYSLLRDYDPSRPLADYEDPAAQPYAYPRGATAQWRAYRWRQNNSPPATDPFAGDYQYRPVGESRGNKFMWVLAAIMIANLFSGRYSVSNTAASGKVVQLSQSARVQPAAPAEHGVAPPSTPVAQQASSYFFVGSSKRDVYRIQGMPDWADDQEWRYGDSRIRFRGQVVESWESKSVPLKAVALPKSDSSRFIRIGSSTKDVLVIQGAPSAVFDGYWLYGQSRIDFEEGRVTGWSESRESPLKVRR